MEVEYLTKTEWTETINQLFEYLSALNDKLQYISSIFYLILFFGAGILLFMLMYKVIKIFM